MNDSTEATVADVVARFFQSRQSGDRVSIDQVLESVGKVTNRAGTRAAALRTIAMRAHSESQGGASSEPDEAATTTPLDELPELDGYDIIDCIGRGGMGMVCEAYQHATGRRVAVKFMLDSTASTEAGRRRFEREVELVARLQHAHIVSVLDSGVHRGRYFYVMDYIDGRSLDVAVSPGDCDVRETLHLIREICGAVDYAHQRGVLHRDLKPSNILIDERGLPHVFDFGLAKAIDPQAESGLEHSLSEPGQLIGTLAYMPPEQSRGQYERMSVRSDVYSLGAITYELLTGALPCPIDGPLAEVLERIANQEPPRPSVYRRKLSPDVDAILLKALSKSPNDRYATAGEFAADIQRYLNDRSILARRPGIGTRFLRWTRRNRRVALVAVAALLAVFVTATLSFLRIRDERDRALAAEQTAKVDAETAEQVAKYLVDMFKGFDPQAPDGKAVAAREILDRAARRLGELSERPAIQASIMDALGSVFRNLGLYDDAAPLLERALAARQRELGNDHPEVANSLVDLGQLRQALGNYAEAQRLYGAALVVLRKHPQERRAIAICLNKLGGLLVDTRDYRQAEQLIREALEIQQALFGENRPDVAGAVNNLAWVLHNTRDYEEAEQLYRRALAIRRNLFGDEHPEVSQSLGNLAGVLALQGRRGEAEELYRQALAMRRKLLGDEHPDVATSLHYLGWLLHRQGNYDEVEPLYREALEIRRKTLPADHPDIARTLLLLGLVLIDKGDATAAEPLLRECLDSHRQALDDGHWLTSNDAESVLGSCLTALGRYTEAEELLLESYPLVRADHGNRHARTLEALQRIVDLYEAWGRSAEAERYRAILAPKPASPADAKRTDGDR